MTMSERTVARVAPDTTNGVVVNIEVVAPDWVNDDPTHLIEYDTANPAGIGWEVKNGVVIRPADAELDEFITPEPVED